MGLHDDDLDEKNQPYNPKYNETIHEFLEAQRNLLSSTRDPHAKYECHRCADCCLSNYYHLNLEAKVLDELYRRGGKYPHGYWVLFEPPKLHLFMPTWGDPPGMVDFDGPLPPKHADFLMVTGRRHGYWVLAKETDKIVVYSPSPCVQLQGKKCLIYRQKNYPEVCSNYSCGRYPAQATPVSR